MMKELHRRLLALFLTVLLSSLFFLGMNRYDNKYTHESAQPVDGLLALSQQDLEDTPLRYLVEGWAFYPGVLLTPEDFAGGDPSRYMVYTAIGERTHLDDLGVRNDPHGSGSYVLHLRLPKGMDTYALDLPEIFSAYRLYIDDRLYLEMGDPAPEHYMPLTQRRLVSFDADGTATILLAVSDFSHFYSGLVYPPAFGTPLALNTARGILLGTCLLIDTLGLVAAALALYAGLRMKQKNALLFSLTCLVMCGFTSYALLHSIAALPVFPWYALELMLGYLLTLLVVILHNRICEVDRLTGRIAAGIVTAFSLAAFCYGLFSPLLTVDVKELFSVAVLLMKAATAIYLLITAGASLKERTGKAQPLFFASVFYATAFVWDRLLPHFEPMLFGWFSEWGSLVLVLAIGYTLWRDITSSYAYSLAFAEEHRQVSRQLDMQKAYSTQLALHSEENKRLMHDFRHHLRTLGGMAASIKARAGAEDLGQQLTDYLAQIQKDKLEISGTFAGAFSPNPAVDAMLGYYFAIARTEHIRADFRLVLPTNLGLSDVELCTVLGNLLENAVEACRKLEGQECRISILSEQAMGNCYIQVVNPFNGVCRRKEGGFLSGKLGYAGFGIGLASVRDIVERHGGSLLFDIEERLFCVGVTLPIKEKG